VTYISFKSVSLCTTSTATECPTRSHVYLLLCTPIKPEVLPLANTSVIQPAPNKEKDQSNSKAQESSSK